MREEIIGPNGIGIPVPERAIDEYEATSALDLLDVMDPLYGAMTVGYVFRGHGHSEWKLEPHLFREARRLGQRAMLWNATIPPLEGTLEIDLLLNFFTEADRRGFDVPEGGERTIRLLHEVKRSGTEHFSGWLQSNRLLQAVALAQHSGVPTRLLDWSRSPHVALYFAARDHLRLERRPEKIAIWAIQSSSLSEMSLQSSIPFEVAGESRQLMCELKIGLLGVGGYANPNLRAQSGELMFPYLRLKGDHTKKGVAKHVDDEVAWLPSAIEELFELAVRHRTSIQNFLPYRQFRKITLPSAQVPALLEFLDRIGINGGAVFPGLSGVADVAKERTYNLRSFESKEEQGMDYIRRVAANAAKLAGMSNDPKWANFKRPHP